MRLFIFVLYFFCFAFNCFAYNIEPYSGQSYAESKKRFNLVFCSLSYPNKEDFKKDTEALIQRLKQTKPFDEFNDFGLWYVKILREEEAEVFKRTSDFPPLKVRNDFLEDIFAKLKANYKLIIIDAGGSTSCAELSSVDKTSLIILGKTRYKDKNSFTKGFLHELGHSLGLRDECINCQQLCPPGEPNCAITKEEAEEWWGELVGKDSRINYISGCCGNKNYIRPTIASLMNDPDKAEDFGPVNERYLREILEGL